LAPNEGRPRDYVRQFENRCSAGYQLSGIVSDAASPCADIAEDLPPRGRKTAKHQAKPRMGE